jgi:hypothetical protein
LLSKSPDKNQLSQVGTSSADKQIMEQIILTFLSVIFFCLCCDQFIKAVVSPIPLLKTERVYARAAMRLGKVYKSTAWGVMTGVFLVGTSYSFYSVFTTL